MSYFAAVFARAARGWTGQEVELDVETLDDVADLIRDHAGEDDSLLLAEQDDEWFAVVRLLADEPRAFISDARAAWTSELAAAFVEVVTELPDEDDTSAGNRLLGAEPGGDPDLLNDLGTDAPTLLRLAGEGVLPDDALTQIAERSGFGEIYEQLR